MIDHTGLRIRVILHVPPHIADQFKKEGKPIAQPIEGMGLVDTAAQFSLITEESALKLNLPIVRRVEVNSATCTDVQGKMYPLELEIPDLQTRFDLPMALGVPKNDPDVIATIGLDILRNLILIYNGSAGSFTLAS